MNSLYFSIGVAIILALVAALVGPLLVDWTAYRATFETRASEILGQPVRVAGAADASLLPIPTLAFSDVVIGADAGAPLMTVGRFDIQVELFPLLSGEVQITSMRLERPVVTVRVDAEGGFEWIADKAAAPVDPARISLSNVEIRDGAVRIVDFRRSSPIEISDVDAKVDARSLFGPYKFDGTAAYAGERLGVKASTGTREPNGEIVLKAALTPASRPVSIALDGRLRANGRQPEWTGRATVGRAAVEAQPEILPWLLEADVEINPARLLAKNLEFRYGPEDRPFSITGATTIDFTDPPFFDAVLSARQIDLDRTLGEGPDKPVAFDDVLVALSSTVEALPKPPFDGRIGFDIPGIVVGGSIVQDVRLDISTAEDGWRVETLEAGLPGRTTVVANGFLATEGGLGFEGGVALASEQPATLVAWWYPQRQKTTLDAFNARAQVSANANGLSVTNLDATAGQARVYGDLAFTPERSARPPRLTLAFGADKLDVSQIQAVAGLWAGPGGTASTEVILQFTGDSLTAGDAVAKGVDVSASLAGGALSIDRFAVQDLAGARVSASGTIKDLASTPDGSIQARIAAEKLGGIAALAAALAPGSEFARGLETAAPVLAPVALDATVTATSDGSATDARITVKGTTGGSDVDAGLRFAGRVDRWRAAEVDLSVDVAGPNGTRLMRQLGFDVPEVESAGLGSLKVSASGTPDDSLTSTVDARLGGTVFKLTGRSRFLEGGDPTADLEVSLTSPDVGPILALGGNMMADVLASTPVDLQASVAMAGPKLTITGLEGTVSGEPVTGDLSADFAPAVPALAGTLDLRSTSLADLAELALGPGTLDFPIVESRSPWPEAPFGPAGLDGLDTDLKITVGRIAVTDDLALDQASLALRSSASGVGLDGISGRFAGGELSGNVVIKRDLEGTAAVSATLKLEGADAGTLVWRRNDRPVVTGTLRLDAELNATGRTVAGLVASLAGGGTFSIGDGRIRSMNPTAFSTVIRAADAGQSLPDDRIRALFTDTVDAGDLVFDRMDGSFTLAAGTLRAPTIQVTTGAAVTAGSASVDLPHQTLESDWTLAVPVPESEGEAPPQVGLLFRGPIADPKRSIDVTAFSSFLGIRSFERETERVLVMQADILERELLSRTVLRAKEEGERRIREEQEAARRAAEEEAARRAAEEQMGLDPAPAPDGPAPDAPAEPDNVQPRAAPGTQGAAPSDTDPFAEQILRQLQKHEPAAPGQGSMPAGG